MAAVSYADAQLGTLLDAMDRADAWRNTTLVLWSDHGYHLGDQEHWGKFTHWEHGTNAPLIIVDPDVGPPGTVVQTPVSLLDIFPTLVELTGIRRPAPPRRPLPRAAAPASARRLGPLRRHDPGRLDLAADRALPLHRLARRVRAALRHGPRPRPGGRTSPSTRPSRRAERLHQRAADEVERLGRASRLPARPHPRHTAATTPSSCRRTSTRPSAATATTPTSRSTPEAIVEKPGGGFDPLDPVRAARRRQDVHARVRGEIEADRVRARRRRRYVRGLGLDDSIIGGRPASAQGRDFWDGGRRYAGRRRAARDRVGRRWQRPTGSAVARGDDLLGGGGSARPA